MSATAKRQIMQALDDLPEQSLASVLELVDKLRAKPLPRSATPGARSGGLGGLWAGYTFSAEDVDEARREMWSGLGEESA